MLVVGAGKASLAIAEQLEQILGDRLDSGVIVVRGGEERPLERIEVLGADHPLPSGRSIAAARRLLELAATAGERDIVIACFTGGSSALASLPPEGVSAAEKHALHELLLSSGIGIVEVNTVRKHVSAFKGGRLAAAALPARLINLTVSDVAGDHIDAITDPSVPTAPGPRTRSRSSTDTGSGTRHRRRSASTCRPRRPSRPSSTGPRSRRCSWSPASTACDAMAIEAAALGLAPVVVSTTLEGEARQVGKLLANLARQSAAHGAPFAPGSVLVGCGGESTVTLAGEGSFGEGGPNQEAAIAAALELDGRPGRRGLPRHRRLRRRHRARRRDRRRADRRAGRRGRPRSARGAARAPLPGGALGARGRARHRTDRNQRQRPVRDRRSEGTQ